MATLSGNTIVTHPETGAPTVLLEGEEIPDWADGLIGDHLIEGAESQDGGVSGGQPPRAGKGSGLEAWQKFADDNQISYPEGASRDEIIAAVDAHDQ